MVHAPSKKAASRQRSEDRFTKIKQRDVDVMDHQRRIHEAETAKLIRLRGLRLAKEAADREAEARAEPQLSPGPKPKRVRSATSKIGVTESEV
jgi:hypothetical protein